VVTKVSFCSIGVFHFGHRVNNQAKALTRKFLDGNLICRFLCDDLATFPLRPRIEFGDAAPDIVQQASIQCFTAQVPSRVPFI
jgi:hypothetical protein